MTASTVIAPGPTIIPSQALGNIEVDPGDAIRVLDPIAGFPGCGAYTLVPHLRGGVESTTIRWLQATEPPYHAFIVADPWAVFPDYAPEIPNSDADQLGVTDQRNAQMLVILTVSGGGISANLRAPVVVNVAGRVAKQVVLLGDAYHTRHEVRGTV